LRTNEWAVERKVEVAKQYDSEVQIYERRRFSGLGGKFFDLLEKNHVVAGLRKCSVLQVGTATGRFTEFLPLNGFDYYGVEISGKMAHHAANRSCNGMGQVLQGDGERLPFRPASFENVLSVRSFHFLPDPDRFARESFDVLLPGGRLVVSFEVLVYLSTLLQAFHIMPKPFPSRTYYRISSVIAIMRRNGFVVIRAGKVTKFPLNLYKKLPNTLLRILIRFHDFMPSWFGTIGEVIGEKPAYLSSAHTGRARNKGI